MIQRRKFLKAAGLATIGMGASPGSLLSHPLLDPQQPATSQKVLVTVFLRGGMDGLNAVVPFEERSYYELRPRIAVPAPSRQAPSALDLNGCFGLHPALGDLLPIYSQGHLAIVHAVGSPEIRSSHFEAQAEIQSILASLSRIGRQDPGSSKPCFTRGDAGYPSGEFGQMLRQAAGSIQAGTGPGTIPIEFGGWDHHVHEGGLEGRLAVRLRELAQGLSAFYRDIGDRMSEVLVLTLSEFGRTVQENSTSGTDHGNAGVMFLMGGPVRGGQIYGEWPGLDSTPLLEGAHLAATTDWTRVLSECLEKHLGISARGGTLVASGRKKRYLNLL